MTHLTTQEVADILKVSGTKVTNAEQVTELARNGVFVGAFREAEGLGKWQIPASEVTRFIEFSQGQKRTRRTKWLTLGFIGFLISVLGLLSVTKDTLDLAVAYIIPTPTPVPTPTPAPLICTARDPLNREGNLGVRNTPSMYGEIVAWWPQGTQFEALNVVPGGFATYYQLGAYWYDYGPIKITGILPDSPAEEVGLRIGDTVLRIDNETSQNLNVLREYVKENAGKEITLVLQRDEEEIELKVAPRVSPPEGQGPIGITWNGGLLEGEGGYFPVMAASCP